MFFSKEEAALLVLTKLALPVITACLNDPNSFLSKKLGTNGVVQAQKVMQFFEGKTSAVDVEAELKKII